MLFCAQPIEDHYLWVYLGHTFCRSLFYFVGHRSYFISILCVVNICVSWVMHTPCFCVLSLYLCWLLTGVSYSADFLSLCVLVHLLWPTRSYFYFNLDRLETRVDLDDLGYTGFSVCLSVYLSAYEATTLMNISLTDCVTEHVQDSWRQVCVCDHGTSDL